jgi:hypothetical protein
MWWHGEKPYIPLDLEHVLRVGPKLESPKRRNFVQVPLPLSVMSTDQVGVARFFREVFEWEPL